MHTTDPDLEGGTAHLIRRDPFLAYQLGRNLNYREFRPRDGAMLAGVGSLAGPMVDGSTAKITANNQLSCLGCHNLPSGTPGGGTNFSKDSGFGRNAPHYFGAGVVEMLALQTREKILREVDLDGDGWVAAAEAQAAPPRALVSNVPGEPALDFGTCRLDGGTTGAPQLDPIFRVWYGLEQPNGAIEVAPDATAIDGVQATHFNFEMVVWGWGQRVPVAALNPTNRAFFWDPAAAHSNLEAHDPSTLDDPDGDGVSRPTLAGAVQFPATHRAPDAGASLHALGFSEDDPDGDGVLNEISEGDLDLAEWFMLHIPRPAFAGTRSEYLRGMRLMQRASCTTCHVPDWEIDAEGGGLAGDRRLFDLAVAWNEERGRLEGRLDARFDRVGEDFAPRREAFRVRGLFSDLRQHDMGDDLAELAFDGNVNRVWRTPPLWGVGSGFPWGHDGRSLTLDDVIRRHGGEAEASRSAYLAMRPAVRDQLLRFLSKLVLYDIETVPTDVDGDGSIEEHFVVQGVDTGVERFNAEWLFETPVRIQGSVLNTDGVLVRSAAATNLAEAYGLHLPYRIDSDLDGWPDVWDVAPHTPGVRDGARN